MYCSDSEESFSPPVVGWCLSVLLWVVVRGEVESRVQNNDSSLVLALITSSQSKADIARLQYKGQRSWSILKEKNSLLAN